MLISLNFSEDKKSNGTALSILGVSKINGDYLKSNINIQIKI